MAELVKNNYDDFCDINAETSLFCGLDYDEFIKTSLSFGQGPIPSNPWGIFKNRHELCNIVTFFSNVIKFTS